MVLAIIACMISYCGSVSGHVHTVVEVGSHVRCKSLGDIIVSLAYRVKSVR